MPFYYVDQKKVKKDWFPDETDVYVEFACSAHVWMIFLRVLMFPPTSLRFVL